MTTHDAVSNIPSGSIHSRSGTILWIAFTALVGFLVPLGGFVVAIVSRHKRFAASRPAFWVLLAVATAVLGLQFLGLLEGGTSFDSTAPTLVQ